jgi:hypothetical protein
MSRAGWLIPFGPYPAVIIIADKVVARDAPILTCIASVNLDDIAAGVGILQAQRRQLSDIRYPDNECANLPVSSVIKKALVVPSAKPMMEKRRPVNGTRVTISG